MAHAKTPKTKRQLLIQLLRKRSGSDIAKMSEQLGWQKHSVRAGITKLRKEGVDIARTLGINGRPSRYQIVGAQAEKAKAKVAAQR
jgi:predicted ArsR family transcriptional regulator